MVIRPLGLIMAWAAAAERRRALRVWGAASFLLIVELVLAAFLHSRAAAADLKLAARNRGIQIIASSGLLEIGSSELGRIQKRLARFNAGLVAKTEIPSILNKISDQAEKNGARVVSIRSEDPQRAAGETGPMRLPIHLTVEGTVRSVGEFLYALENSLDRVFVVESMRLGKKRSLGESAPVCEMVLVFFSKE